MFIDTTREEVNDAPSALLTNGATARRMGIHSGTLEQMRMKGEGPRYVRIGRRVLYRPQDIDDWIAEHVVDPAAA